MRTDGRRSVSTENCPSIVTRPPSIAQCGWMAVMREGAATGDGMKRKRSREDGLRALRVVQLGVPIEVVAPAFRRVSDSDRDADRRRGMWTPRHPLQVHVRPGRRPAALLPVAADAAGDDV